MTNKQRGRMRHKNYVAWKKAQKEQKALAASGTATTTAAPAESAAQAPTSAAPVPAPQVSPEPRPAPQTIPEPAPAPESPAIAPSGAPSPSSAADSSATTDHPGALIPYDPAAPVNVKLLYERLRHGGPEVTNEERIAIAHRIEQRWFEPPFNLLPPEEVEEYLLKDRSVLARTLQRFGINWVTLALEAMTARFLPNVKSNFPRDLASHVSADISRDISSHVSPNDSSNNERNSASPSYAPGQSTGPRTPAGKQRSSQNARTHGLSSLTSVFVLLAGEDPKEWLELLHDLTQEYRPATRTERILVNEMAQGYWLTQRAINLQTNHIDDPKLFALFLRYQTTHQRAYHRALKQLLALQKTRAKSGSPAISAFPPPGFDATVDPSTIPPVEPDPASGPPQEQTTLPQAA